MPLADNKKAQTVHNLWHTRVADRILRANDVVAAIRAAITTAGIAGEFSAAELTAMQAVETSLSELAALPGITAAASKHEPTHQVEPDTVGLEV